MISLIFEMGLSCQLGCWNKSHFGLTKHQDFKLGRDLKVILSVGKLKSRKGNPVAALGKHAGSAGQPA